MPARKPTPEAVDGSVPVESHRRRFRVSLRWVILVATLAAGLVPVALMTWSSIAQDRTEHRQSLALATKALDDNSIAFLEAQTAQTAGAISQFLDERVEDTRSAVLLPRTPETYLAFSQAHMGTIRYPTRGQPAPREQRDTVPI